MDTLTCMLCHLHETDLSDSHLVQHLLLLTCWPQFSFKTFRKTTASKYLVTNFHFLSSNLAYSRNPFLLIWKRTCSNNSTAKLFHKILRAFLRTKLIQDLFMKSGVHESAMEQACEKVTPLSPLKYQMEVSSMTWFALNDAFETALAYITLKLGKLLWQLHLTWSVLIPPWYKALKPATATSDWIPGCCSVGTFVTIFPASCVPWSTKPEEVKQLCGRRKHHYCDYASSSDG